MSSMKLRSIIDYINIIEKFYWSFGSKEREKGMKMQEYVVRSMMKKSHLVRKGSFKKISFLFCLVRESWPLDG